MLHNRITGVPPTAANLTTMTDLPPRNDCRERGALRLQQPTFYNVTLRNIFAAGSNRDGSVFVPLNDYIVDGIGMVRDNVPYNTALSRGHSLTLKRLRPAAAVCQEQRRTTRLLKPRCRTSAPTW